MGGRGRAGRERPLDIQRVSARRGPGLPFSDRLISAARSAAPNRRELARTSKTTSHCRSGYKPLLQPSKVNDKSCPQIELSRHFEIWRLSPPNNWIWRRGVYIRASSGVQCARRQAQRPMKIAGVR